MKKILQLLLISFFSITQAQETTFTSDDIYTVPTGITKIWIEVIGAGGDGKSNGLSGGGGGGYALGSYTVTPGQMLDITVAQTGTNGTTKVDELIQASSGTDATYSRDDDGYGIIGIGGKGTNGNIANNNGGNGGKGYWTYYGGGGGGAAGPNGNGTNGGDTKTYESGGCSHEGGTPGISGGYPGSNGGKGAGYYNCGHGSANWNPSIAPQNYGGGGSGGNGSGYARTIGANGFVRISTKSLVNGVTQIGLTLHAHDTESNYQWIDENANPINGETNRNFNITQPGSYAVQLSSEGYTRTSSYCEISADDIINNSATYGTVNFETSSSFTHNNKITNSAFIEVLGAGGHGRSNGLSGGGGGGYAAGIYTLTEAQTLDVQVATAGTSEISKVDEILQATSGSSASYSRDADGFGIVGAGGVGTGGNITNHTGGNGGKGYWTYYGGGGGGAAGRNNDGSNGGDTKTYESGGCSHEGGTAGQSGGYPGSNGGKGAGYNNCGHGSANWNPSTSPDNYGGGGAGGNGSGYASTNGANGFVRISYCDITLNILKDGNTLTLINPGTLSYQWVKIKADNTIEYISDAHNTEFIMPSDLNKYALYVYSDLCSILSESYSPEIPTSIINEMKTDKMVKVYPNPAINIINVEAEDEILKIQLISDMGTVKRETKNPNINLGDLPRGIYFVKVFFESETIVKKVLVN